MEIEITANNNIATRQPWMQSPLKIGRQKKKKREMQTEEEAACAAKPGSRAACAVVGALPKAGIPSPRLWSWGLAWFCFPQRKDLG